jgi:branched-chain amino acid transport system ATP-binding protein
MLSIQNLNTHYGASHVLQGVDLELSRGRIAAVLGRNGVGKTTTVKTIMGLVPATSGTVALEGRSITAWPPHRVARAGVAYVPEGRLIFPDLTVVENIRVAERTPAKAWPLERLLTLFPSLSERQSNRGSQLSGGEQQMLAIARALMTNPQLLIMDEPSEGLAPIMIEAVAEQLQHLKEGSIGLLLVEQNYSLATRLADVVYVVENGSVVFRGSADELNADDDV